MRGSQARRVRLVHRGTLQGRPQDVFPQLCPTREHDWLEGWSADVVYSESGYAEEGCVFTTDLEAHATWIVTRHEPPERIDFAIFVAGAVVARLAITVEAAEGGGSHITWERTTTSLSPAGDVYLDGLTQVAFDQRMASLDRRLDHYLRCGTMLRDSDETDTR